MSTLIAAALAFPVVAALIVALAGRREAAGSDRLSAAALGMLVALPLLALLPGWPVLPATAGPAGSTAPAFISAVVLGGILIGSGRLFLAWIRLRGWIRRSRPLGHRTTPEGRRIGIRMLSTLASPCAVGVCRPLILVPAGWSGLSRARQEMALAHEIAHHRRRDPWWRLVGAVACCLYWFNPLVCWLARRHAFQAELACDAAVLATGTRPEPYAHLLCDLAHGPATPLAAAMSGSTLGRRVEHLQRPRCRLPRPLLGLALLMIGAAGLACGLGRPMSPADPAEVQIRLSADPFPGNPVPWGLHE